MYHKVHPDSPSMWWVSVNEFYRQMSEISNKEVVYLNDYDVNDPNHVVITFDGIYKNILEYAAPILKHFEYPFELFITSDYIGIDNEFDSVESPADFASVEELAELVNLGGRLQWHTKTHQNLSLLQEIKDIKEELHVPEELLNIDVNGFSWFAYPYGDFNEKVLNEVKKKFLGAVSCNQGNDSDMHALNRLTVVNGTRLRKDKIACIIASYNYGQYLIEAIESVLRQTVIPDEILISDDYSDDETETIAKIYCDRYPKLIRYNRNEKNLGIVDHFNKAISLINSEYVFFLGADNRILSNYVEESARVLDENENIAIAYTDYAFFGSRAKLAFMKFPEDRKGKTIENTFYQVNFPAFDNRTELETALIRGNFIHGSSMFKKTEFYRVGGYLKSNTAEDYHLFSRMVNSGSDAKKALNTNLEYRQHSVGQVNNLVSLHNSLNLYRNLYSQKKHFENSKIYKIAYRLYVLKRTPKKIIVKKIIRKIFR